MRNKEKAYGIPLKRWETDQKLFKGFAFLAAAGRLDLWGCDREATEIISVLFSYLIHSLTTRNNHM